MNNQPIEQVEFRRDHRDSSFESAARIKCLDPTCFCQGRDDMRPPELTQTSTKRVVH